MPLTSVIPCSHENVKPFAASMDVHMWYGVGVMWVWCRCDVGVVWVLFGYGVGVVWHNIHTRHMVHITYVYSEIW